MQVAMVVPVAAAATVVVAAGEHPNCSLVASYIVHTTHLLSSSTRPASFVSHLPHVVNSFIAFDHIRHSLCTIFVDMVVVEPVAAAVVVRATNVASLDTSPVTAHPEEVAAVVAAATVVVSTYLKFPIASTNVCLFPKSILSCLQTVERVFWAGLYE